MSVAYNGGFPGAKHVDRLRETTRRVSHSEHYDEKLMRDIEPPFIEQTPM